MNIKVSVIVDNISDNDIRGEWGLSLLVEYYDKKIIVDVGASNLFLQNLSRLGFDIKDIEYAVLSHAHFDHANGMKAFFDNNLKAKFYLRNGVSEDCYFKKFFFHKYIGIPKNVINNYSDRIEYVSGNYEIIHGVYLVPHTTCGLSEIGKREMMYRKTNTGWIPDDFVHEQSLVLDTEKGLIIINSCSHGGVINIINEVSSVFPGKHIYGYIGGFHLFNKSNAVVREVGRKLNDLGIEYVCTGHCTKERAYGILKEELGDKLEQMKVGLQIEL